MQLAKKIAIGCVFSVGMIVVVIDALRIATGDGGGIISQAALYDALEPAIAVLVSCLPTYRSLFTSMRGSSNDYKADQNRYQSGSQQGLKDRIGARYRSEAYELDDSEAPSPPPTTL